MSQKVVEIDKSNFVFAKVFIIFLMSELYIIMNNKSITIMEKGQKNYKENVGTEA
jgi:hypothetical protein